MGSNIATLYWVLGIIVFIGLMLYTLNGMMDPMGNKGPTSYLGMILILPFYLIITGMFKFYYWASGRIVQKKK